MGISKDKIRGLTRFIPGILWIIIAGFYVTDRWMNHLPFRPIDYLAWTVMGIAGLQGIRAGLISSKVSKSS